MCTLVVWVNHFNRYYFHSCQFDNNISIMLTGTKSINLFSLLYRFCFSSCSGAITSLFYTTAALDSSTFVLSFPIFSLRVLILCLLTHFIIVFLQCTYVQSRLISLLCVKRDYYSLVFFLCYTLVFLTFVHICSRTSFLTRCACCNVYRKENCYIGFVACYSSL